MRSILRALGRFISALLSLFAVPAIGVAVGDFMLVHHFPIALYGLLRIQSEKAGLFLCGLSLAAAALGALLIFLLWCGAAICGEDRNRLARVFGTLIRTCCVMLALLAMMQMSIVLISGVLMTLRILHIVPLAAVLAVIGGAVYGAKELARIGLSMSHPIEQGVAGVPCSPETQPRLWQKLAEVASLLGARLPDHVILGLDPGFFVTAATIRLLDSKAQLEGETLYLSVPSLRLLSQLELSAVIGHELHHFAGEDTAFSMRFVPIYQGLFQALSAAHGSSGWQAVSLFSARAILGQGIVWFARADNRISRRREIEADRAGAQVASAESAIATLVRLAATGGAWARIVGETIQGINQGSPSTNIAADFAVLSLTILRDSDRDKLLASLADIREPHPTDTHPTLYARAEALGVALRDVAVVPDETQPSAWALLDEADALENLLSERFRTRLISAGVAKPPRDPNRPNFVQKKRLQRQAQADARKRRIEAEAITETPLAEPSP
jgi:Zn-dependent protease with chaperone function